MTFGITPQGFNLKRLADIKLEIEDDLKEELGPGINLLPEEVLGQIVGIMSERESEIWLQLQAVYNSQYPDTSEGVNLDNVASITGAVRKTPTKSVILGQLFFGTLATIIPIGSIVSVAGNSTARFLTLAAVTLITGLDEVQTLTLSGTPSSGDFEINFNGETITADFDDDAAALQVKFDAVFGAGIIVIAGDISSGGPVTLTFTGDTAIGFGKRDVALVTITNNTLDDGGPVTVTPTETTKGIAQGEANMEAETEGPTVANSTTLNVIETPIAGWDATANPLDAAVGQEVETDAEFRIRRTEQVALAGAATPSAIFSDLIQINNVDAVIVFFNNTDITDLDGRPSHSVDIVVNGGDDDVIAQAIFDVVAAGIGFVGDITKVVKDLNNFDQTVKFSRPTDIDIHVEIDLSIDTDIFPVDGLAQVEAAILAYGNAFGIGDDVVVFGSVPSLSCSFEAILGITDFAIRVGKTVSPTLDDNVILAPRELAQFDSSRITVVTI